MNCTKCGQNKEENRVNIIDFGLIIRLAQEYRGRMRNTCQRCWIKLGWAIQNTEEEAKKFANFIQLKRDDS